MPQAKSEAALKREFDINTHAHAACVHEVELMTDEELTSAVKKLRRRRLMTPFLAECLLDELEMRREDGTASDAELVRGRRVLRYLRDMNRPLARN